MFSRLLPYKKIKSVYDFDFKSLYDEGFRVLLFDIDNTIVPDNAPADDKSVRLFIDLHEIGFETYIISNNDLERVKTFADKIGSKYYCKAKKPSPRYYLKAVMEAGYTTQSAACFGDQIFTDVWGANNAGIKAYLVEPIDRGSERTHIKLKRILEKIVTKLI